MGAVFGVTTIIGPLLGGYFTDHLSWRWAFYVNVPVAVVVVAMAAVTIPAVRATARPIIDWAGIVFVAIGAGGLTLATSWGGTTYGWGSVQVLGLIGVSVVALAVFVFVEQRAAEPILPMRLFSSRVFSVCSALALVVGFAMLGSITFLPTFLQYVNGVSATSSGVRMLPLVAGLLITSIAAGTIVGKTGRYKIFPVVGTLIMAVGLFLMSRLNEHTSVLVASGYMVVLGAGIGLCMQVLTLIVQNTSSYRDLGVATSGVTFFRTLGSSFGAAVFGSLFANFLASRLPDALRASPGVNPAVTNTPKALHALPAAQIQPIVHAYAESLERVFLWAIPVALAGFLLALALKEVPLRGTAKASAGDLGDGFGMPSEQSSEQQLERAIAAILRERGREHAARILDRSGTSLTTALAWGVIQIMRFAHVRGGADIEDIARWYRLPAAVLEPTFQELASQGMVARSNGSLTLTPAGRKQGEQLVNALRAWLVEQLADWELNPADEQINRALDHIARRMLNDDETDSRPRQLTAATPAPAG